MAPPAYRTPGRGDGNGSLMCRRVSFAPEHEAGTSSQLHLAAHQLRQQRVSEHREGAGFLVVTFHGVKETFGNASKDTGNTMVRDHNLIVVKTFNRDSLSSGCATHISNGVV